MNGGFILTVQSVIRFHVTSTTFALIAGEPQGATPSTPLWDLATNILFPYIWPSPQHLQQLDKEMLRLMRAFAHLMLTRQRKRECVPGERDRIARPAYLSKDSIRNR